MKFTCGNCSTGYSVPDEKVRGKRVRITCRKCGTAIIVEGRTSDAPTASLQPQHVKPVRSMMKTQLGLQAPIAPGGAAFGAGPATPARTSGQMPAGDARLPAPPLMPRIAGATRQEDASQPRVSTKPSAPRLPASSTLRDEDERWSVAVSRRDPRKMTSDQVIQALESGLINDHTLVWKRGMDAWKPLAWVPRFAAVTGKRVGASESEEPPPPTARGARRPEPADAHVESPRPPASLQAELPSSDFDDEPTKVIDQSKAHALLAQQEARPQATASPAEPSPSAETKTAAAFEEEDDIARAATSEAAQELLRGTPETRAAVAREPSVVVSPDAEKPEPVIEPPAAKVPSLPPAADDAKRTPSSPPDMKGASSQPPTDGKRISSRPPTEGKRPSYHPPVQVSIQNEATRIVRVKKSGRNSMIIGLLIVAVASAAGGFLASRFLAPHTPVGAPSAQ